MSAHTVALRLSDDPHTIAGIAKLISDLSHDEADRVLHSVDDYQTVTDGCLRGATLMRAVGVARDRVVAMRPSAEGPAEDLEQLRFTDVGLSRRLAFQYGRHIRWVGPEKRFYWYDGTIWVPDHGRQVDAFQKDLVRRLVDEAIGSGDERASTRLAVGAASAQRIRAAVDLCRSEPGIAISPAAFDADPLSLNCMNGLLDLRTLKVRAHIPEDLCTLVTAAPFVPTMRNDAWERFLDRTMPAPALRTWVQCAFGYCVAGLTDADLILIIFGPGGSGKSTLVHAVVAALGTYATTTPFETFARHDRKPGQATPELEPLIGRRLVCAFEGSGSLKLSEERLKGIASGDRSSSRGLFKEEREYAATFKVALVTNDRPVVRGDDDALWRRLRVVPLAHKVPEESVDPELRSRLQQDPDVRGAVLAWLVEGWRLYREQGLKASEEVRLASDAYRGAVDRVHAFISASLIVEHGSFASNDGLRDALQAWNEENEEQVQRADVITSLKKNGCVSDTARACGKSVRGWRGVRFISDRPRTAHQAPAGLRDQ